MNAKELDEARWAEACRRVPALGEALTPSRKRTRIYRELVIEGWEPPKDELAEAIQAVWCYALGCEHVPVERAENLRTELAARGLTIGKAVRQSEALEHLTNVLFADPGPKLTAVHKAAREWWSTQDRSALAAGEGEKW